MPKNIENPNLTDPFASFICFKESNPDDNTNRVSLINPKNKICAQSIEEEQDPQTNNIISSTTKKFDLNTGQMIEQTILKFNPDTGTLAQSIYEIWSPQDGAKEPLKRTEITHPKKQA